MNKRVLLISVCVLCFGAIVLVLNRGLQPHNGNEGLRRASLRLQWLHQAQFAGFYVAKEKGFYEDKGIDLDIRAGGQDYNAATLVGSGSDDFGIWTADQVLLAAANGVPIRAVGVVFDRTLAAYMVHKDSSIITPKDFEGKTVGMYYGFDSETIYEALIDTFNVDRSTIHETALKYDLQRFFNQEVDVWPAYVINQPLVAEQKHVPIRLLRPDDFGIRYYSDTIIVNRALLETDPSFVRAFLEASEAGWRYALAHPEEATDIVLKYAADIDRTFQRRMLEVASEYLRKDGPMFAMSPETWRSIAALLEQYVVKGKKLPLDETVVYTVE